MEESLIPNTQIEAMFMRVCSDDQMSKYVSLVEREHISLATAYASNIINTLWYPLVKFYEENGGSIEDLKKTTKKPVGVNK